MCALIVNKEKKREDIILAALMVFAEKGFSRTTIKDIAEHAGIGKGTVYEYFNDKDEIIYSSFSYFLSIFETDMEKILLSDRSGINKFNELVLTMTKIIESEQKKLLDLMFDFWAEGIRSNSKGPMLEEMQKFYTLYRKIFTDVISEGMADGTIRKDIDPDATASLIVGMLDGIVVQWILDKKNFKVGEIQKVIPGLLINGVGETKINGGEE